MNTRRHVDFYMFDFRRQSAAICR